MDDALWTGRLHLIFDECRRLPDVDSRRGQLEVRVMVVPGLANAAPAALPAHVLVAWGNAQLLLLVFHLR